MVSEHALPRAPKSAERIEGAMIAGGAIVCFDVCIERKSKVTKADLLGRHCEQTPSLPRSRHRQLAGRADVYLLPAISLESLSILHLTR